MGECAHVIGGLLPGRIPGQHDDAGTEVASVG